jgi:hypothetical protein
MVRPGREQLSGLVEVDETYVGAREAGVDGRLVHGKAIVLIAVELHEPNGLGRARLAIVPEPSRLQIFDFVTRSVEQGATVRTDGWNIYNTLPDSDSSMHRAPCRVTAQTLDRRHPARGDQSRTSRLLPRRVHLPLQSPELEHTRVALLSTARSSRPAEPLTSSDLVGGSMRSDILW